MLCHFPLYSSFCNSQTPFSLVSIFFQFFLQGVQSYGFEYFEASSLIKVKPNIFGTKKGGEVALLFFSKISALSEKNYETLWFYKAT